MVPGAPGCVILDVCMPGINGLDVQSALARRAPDMSIVFVTAHGDVPMSVQAMKNGAVDFLSKPFRAADLLAAVRQALRKNAQARKTASKLAGLRARAAQLTPREREVMALVVKGKLNKQAGRELGITEKTVKAHRARVMRKMRADSLAELVRMSEKIRAQPG